MVTGHLDPCDPGQSLCEAAGRRGGGEGWRKAAGRSRSGVRSAVGDGGGKAAGPPPRILRASSQEQHVAERGL